MCSPCHNFSIARNIISLDIIFISTNNLQSILLSGFLIGKLILLISTILKPTILLSTYLCFTTTFVSLSFCFILKLHLISSISLSSIPFLSTKIYKVNTFSRAFFTCAYYFLIVSACIAILLPILIFTTILPCLLLLSLKVMPLFIFITTSMNITLLPKIAFSNLVKNSIHSETSSLGIKNRMLLIFTTSGYCVCYTLILILYLSKLHFTYLIIFSISSSCANRIFANTNCFPLFSLLLEKYFCIYVTDSGTLSVLLMYLHVKACTFATDTSRLSSC